MIITPINRYLLCVFEGEGALSRHVMVRFVLIQVSACDMQMDVRGCS